MSPLSNKITTVVCKVNYVSCVSQGIYADTKVRANWKSMLFNLKKRVSKLCYIRKKSTTKNGFAPEVRTSMSPRSNEIATFFKDIHVFSVLHGFATSKIRTKIVSNQWYIWKNGVVLWVWCGVVWYGVVLCGVIKSPPRASFRGASLVTPTSPPMSVSPLLFEWLSVCHIHMSYVCIDIHIQLHTHVYTYLHAYFAMRLQRMGNANSIDWPTPPSPILRAFPMCFVPRQDRLSLCRSTVVAMQQGYPVNCVLEQI